jgi:molybdopterin synthase catalytic subunit
MKIRVKLFAILREKAGTDDLILELPPGSVVATASAMIAEKYPQLEKWIARTGYAVNREYANATILLHDDDELAMIPPVSGGSNQS